jgi:hypothetical protein
MKAKLVAYRSAHNSDRYRPRVVPYGKEVELTLYGYSEGEEWDPHIRIYEGEEGEHENFITLTLSQSEMLETALRVARQAVRPKR